MNPPSGSRIRTQRTGTANNPVEYHTAVSEAISTVRSPLPYQLAISAASQTVVGVFGHHGKVGQPLALEARPPYLARAAWRGRFVEGGIQPAGG